MSIHHLKNLLIESLVLGALVFYLAMMIAALVGLTSWILGGQEFLLKASWVGWCATIAMIPFGLRIIFGPDARVICNHCRTWMASWLKHPRRTLPQKEQSQHPQKEQRQFPRYPVKFPARLATDHRPCGFGMIGDLSVKGCRVKSKTTLAPGDFGKLLINLPTGITPLTVSLTSVRWVNGYECGLEFILMDRDEQGCLNRQLEPVVAVVP